MTRLFAEFCGWSRDTTAVRRIAALRILWTDLEIRVFERSEVHGYG